MAWTTPKTDWSTGELVSAADLNTMNENLAALRHPSTAVAAYTTTEDIVVDTDRELFEDIDSTNLNLTLVTAGGDVMVHFHGVFTRGSDRDTDNCLDILLDGNRQGGEDGLMRFGVYGRRRAQSFTHLFQNLGAGSHTFKLQWRNWKLVRLYAGAQFWVREI
ncbi:MAG: hypothetical protein OXE52_00765 [Chloroflexi bacterium]|nr:hypothetical protein [Chloroflexota bacterium]